ncbi:MOSC domain-containing protein [Rhodobacteraceae bacterium NNCM2]|nr:MOSC domain-containing protein [Coraliihabitans acroporae]
MMASVARICRHPVKSLGEEIVEAVTLEAGKHLPWDRVWAVCHGNSQFDAESPEWVRARNFVTQTFVPNLVQISISLDEATGKLSLDHPDAAAISVDPDADPQALCDWLLPLAEAQRPGPYRIARVPQTALTDFPDTHIALNSTSSLAALEEVAGAPLHHTRFRGNLWLDGLEPWQEFDLVGQEIKVGEARLKVVDPIRRCNATKANPATGERDVEVPELLRERWGHMNFGVYAQVIGGGRVRTGDAVAVV